MNLLNLIRFHKSRRRTFLSQDRKRHKLSVHKILIYYDNLSLSRRIFFGVIELYNNKELNDGRLELARVQSSSPKTSRLFLAPNCRHHPWWKFIAKQPPESSLLYKKYNKLTMTKMRGDLAMSGSSVIAAQERVSLNIMFQSVHHTLKTWRNYLKLIKWGEWERRFKKLTKIELKAQR